MVQVGGGYSYLLRQRRKISVSSSDDFCDKESGNYSGEIQNEVIGIKAAPDNRLNDLDRGGDCNGNKEDVLPVHFIRNERQEEAERDE